MTMTVAPPAMTVVIMVNITDGLCRWRLCRKRTKRGDVTADCSVCESSSQHHRGDGDDHP